LGIPTGREAKVNLRLVAGMVIRDFLC